MWVNDLKYKEASGATQAIQIEFTLVLPVESSDIENSLAKFEAWDSACPLTLFQLQFI